MLNFCCFFPKFRKNCQNFAEFSPNFTKLFRDFSKMQEHQEKIPNGQRRADSAGPTARGLQRRAGPDVWPISARSSASRPEQPAALSLTAPAAPGVPRKTAPATNFRRRRAGGRTCAAAVTASSPPRGKMIFQLLRCFILTRVNFLRKRFALKTRGTVNDVDQIIIFLVLATNR